MTPIYMTPIYILRAAGEALFGEDWRKPMTDLISQTNLVDSRRVRRWADGTKPLDPWMIDWIMSVLPGVLEGEARRLENNADAMRSIVASILGGELVG